MMLLGVMSSAQISYTYGWEPAGDGSWTSSGSGSFSRSETTPCTGTAGMRANNYYNATSYLVSPALTGTNGGNLNVSFAYKVTEYSSNSTGVSLADFGVIKLAWATSETGPWTTAYTIDDTSHVVSASCATKSATILGVPSSGNLFIRFEAQSGLTTSDNYVYFDDINITQGAAPTCFSPSSVTASNMTTATADISWTAPTAVPASGYELYYSTSATPPTATTPPTYTNIAGTSKALSGLSPSVQYYVWVRSNCTTTDKSIWTAVYSFTTPCLNTSLPYTLDFENVTTPDLPTCTSIFNAGTGNDWRTTLPGEYGFANKALTYVYHGTNAANAWFFTQGVNLTAGVQYNISYKYGNNGGTTYVEKLKVAYGNNPSVSAMTNSIADHPNIVNGTSSTVSALSSSVDFTPTVTGIYYFGFNAYSAADRNRLYVDDISITQSSLATSETALAKNNLKVSPNPFADILNISDVSNVKSISVMDIAGRLVKTFDKPESTLHLGGLNAGMYLVVLNMKDGSKQTIKAIKK